MICCSIIYAKLNSLAPRIEYPAAWIIYGISLGDLDGDAKPDIVSANRMSDSLTIIRNAVPYSRLDVGVGLEPIGVAIVDLDGDGRPEIVAANQSSKSLSILRNTSIATPRAPMLTFPSNGARGVQTSSTLRWNVAEGATSHRLQVSTSPGFTSSLFDDSTLTSPSQLISGLNHNSEYYWRVRGTNTFGPGAWSAVWSFTTVVAAPVLASPLNEATGVPTASTLSWQASAGATAYRLQVSTSPGFNSTVFDDSTLTTTSLPVVGLNHFTQYYWRVNARNAGGTSAWSSVWKFVTVIAPPNAPSLHSPANNAGNISRTPRFFWRRVPDANSYSMQIARESQFAAPIMSVQNITDTSYAFLAPLDSHSVHYWRVCGSNPGGNGAWSPVWVFATGTQIVNVPSAEMVVPDRFRLEHNYPNPFNPSTTMTIALPVRSGVRLEIFNFAGQLVEVLLDQQMQAGVYQMVWRANAPSGIYLCRLTAVPVESGAQPFVQTQKMVLMR